MSDDHHKLLSSSPSTKVWLKIVSASVAFQAVLSWWRQRACLFPCLRQLWFKPSTTKILNRADCQRSETHTHTQHTHTHTHTHNTHTHTHTHELLPYNERRYNYICISIIFPIWQQYSRYATGEKHGYRVKKSMIISKQIMALPIMEQEHRPFVTDPLNPSLPPLPMFCRQPLACWHRECLVCSLMAHTALAALFVSPSSGIGTISLAVGKVGVSFKETRGGSLSRSVAGPG